MGSRSRRGLAAGIVVWAMMVAGLLLVVERTAVIRLRFPVDTEQRVRVQVFWDAGAGFRERGSWRESAGTAGWREISVVVPARTRALRIDPGNVAGKVWIGELGLSRVLSLCRWPWPAQSGSFGDWRPVNDLEERARVDGGIALLAVGGDPVLENRTAGAQLARGLRWERVVLGLAAALVALPVGLRGWWALGVVVRAWRQRRAGGRRRLLLGAVTATAATLVSGGLGLVVLKLVVRPPSGYDRAAGQAFGLRLVDPQGRRLSKLTGPLALVVDPFAVYRNLPNQRTPHFSIDEHGFRGGVPAAPRSRVALLGGSAAFGFGVGDSETITARLNAADRRYAFINAAVVGYTSGQELALMVNHVDRWRPAVYVTLDGWNDFIVASRVEAREDRLAPRPLGVSGQYYRLIARAREWCLSTGECSKGERPPPRPPVLTKEQWAEAGLQAFVDNVERMHVFARGRGAKFVVLLQPHLSSKRWLTDAEQALGEQQLAAEYRRFAARATAALRERGVTCADLNVAAEVTESRLTLFLDGVHLTAHGNDLVAGAVRRILEGGAASRPVGAGR